VNLNKAEHPAAPAHGTATLAQIAQRRATANGAEIAYTFLANGAADARSMTWAQLDRRATALGTTLFARGASGKMVLLALPSGLAFIEALFACWYAGAVAVPVSLPRHHRVKDRLRRIIQDSEPSVVIATNSTRQGLERQDPIGADLQWIDPEADTIDASPASASYRPSLGDHLAGEQTALLQYTSGSTAAPRGVVITHANLMRNSALIAEACGHQPGETIAGWLPLFHDMGLVGLVLQAAFAGLRCVFMSPERFLMRPSLWLQMISQYSACSSPAPNFAYDLCVDKITMEQKVHLDLSRWRNALNGSEPVRAATIDRFSSAFASCGFVAKAFFPCYGLAEATLLVTGPGKMRQSTRRHADGSVLVPGETGGYIGCGLTFGDTRLSIVDPQTLLRVAPGSIGEIWVAGESCASRYWNDPQATAATFNAHLDGSNPEEVSLKWLRTGDLGYVAGGELFIVGRLRDLIIIAGRNHFPVDLERTIEAADAAIAPSGALAFSVDVSGVERLVVAAEVRRGDRQSKFEASNDIEAQAICRRVRAAVALEHEVVPHDIVLLPAGALPRTTSGKLSRRSARDAYLTQTLIGLKGSSHVGV
jgi:acyl-CoA synthetase (AMP-forming)/AMP-acid ligase II